MHDPFPTLRDHLFDPSGGLTYQLRALRYRRSLWAGFHAVVAGWLSEWRPDCRNLVMIGPNAGRLTQTLAAAGHTLDQIDEVYITHMHGDHLHGSHGHGHR